MTRQRLRVEALEGQNRELQGDLRVMEQERLVWWQQQVRGSVYGKTHCSYPSVATGHAGSPVLSAVGTEGVKPAAHLPTSHTITTCHLTAYHIHCSPESTN